MQFTLQISFRIQLLSLGILPPQGWFERDAFGDDRIRSAGEDHESTQGPKRLPVDLEQTHESLKSYLVEEAYEVLDANRQRK